MCTYGCSSMVNQIILDRLSEELTEKGCLNQVLRLCGLHDHKIHEEALSINT